MVHAIADIYNIYIHKQVPFSTNSGNNYDRAIKTRKEIMVH